MPESQIVKWGNSLAVRIPKPLAEEAGVREGDAIVIEAVEGLINLRPKLRVPTLAELVAQITRGRVTSFGLILTHKWDASRPSVALPW